MNHSRLIIGFALLAALFLPGFAHAEDTPSDNCVSTLYSDNFVCDSAKVRSFCSTVALSGEKPDALVSTDSMLAYYKTAYCNSHRTDDDAIYKAVSDQMLASEPNWTPDLVKAVLAGLSQSNVLALVKDVKDLPLSIVDYLVNDPSSNKGFDILNRVKNAYEKEKMLEGSKSSMKQEFQGREMWMNGKLDDAPFDLVVDLNLIEITLFGSQAQWMNDVYSFPPKNQDNGTPPASTNSATPGNSESNNGTSQTQPPGTNPQTPSANTNQCVPTTQPNVPTTSGDNTNPGTNPTGNNPSNSNPASAPATCGNGKLDPGEECDDGNTVSGDGCSGTCTLEQGNTLACMDPQAVTFKSYTPPAAASQATGSATGTATTQSSTGEDTGFLPPTQANPQGQDECPAGTTPAGPVTEIPQPPNYPGPNVGGVLKDFPPSERPDCPDGTSSADITIAGTTYSRCVPTSTCGDYEAARKLLFGDDYASDPVKAEAAAAIEAFVCVKVLKIKRPESPYPLNEGCVDCHILAMNDVMSKLLDQNVQCMENPKEAWGLSNRWGPSFSFNLDVVTAQNDNAEKRKLDPKKSDETVADKTGTDASKIRQDATRQQDPNQTQPDATVSATMSVDQILNAAQQQKDKQANDIRQDLLFYSAASESDDVDSQIYGPLSEMLTQMMASFTNLQKSYVGISVLDLDKKETCKK
jgi:cysteine-rich repeat protein